MFYIYYLKQAESKPTPVPTENKGQRYVFALTMAVVKSYFQGSVISKIIKITYDGYS